MESSTNKNCENCETCFGCVNCKDCEGCIGCVNCTGCKNCVGCVDCYNCEDCSNCKSCKDCIRCDKCDSCETCRSCEEGVCLKNWMNYFPFTDAKYSFPYKGCCTYSPLVEEFLVNNKFMAYNTNSEFGDYEHKYITWNYGILFRRYWFTKRPTKNKFEIASLLNFIMINKLYYNDEGEVSANTLIAKGLTSKLLKEYILSHIEPD